ncbi:MAG: hypothetical protein JNL74_09265, partial [Fibrobacteres bacterium]|nr:hypothetical protein [Fibrobacterota bacterium]
MSNNLSRFAFVPAAVIILHVVCSFCYAVPSIVLDAKPQNMQLFPRGADDSASVGIGGYFLRDTTFHVLKAEYRRNGILFAAESLLTDSSNADTIRFYFSRKIAAELAQYSLILRADTATLFSAESLLAGDVILING